MLDIYEPTSEQRVQFLWKDPLPCIIDFGHELRRIGLNKIVDLGCRTGKQAIALAKIGLNVIAIDKNKENLSIVVGQAQDQKITTICQASNDIPLKDEEAHALVTATTIQHLTPSDSKKLTDEIYRILIPGGRVLVAVLSVDDYRYGTGKEIAVNTFESTSGPEIGTLHQFFSKESLISLFSSFIPECKPFIVSSTYIFDTPTGKKQGTLIVGKFYKGVNAAPLPMPLNLIDGLRGAKKSIELLFIYPTNENIGFGSSCLDFFQNLTLSLLENVFYQCIVVGNCLISKMAASELAQKFENNKFFSLAYSEQPNEAQVLNIAIVDGVAIYSCTHSELSEHDILYDTTPKFVPYFRSQLTSIWRKATVFLDNGKFKKYTLPSVEKKSSEISETVKVVDFQEKKKKEVRIGIAQMELNTILASDDENQLLKPDLQKLPNAIDHILLNAAQSNLKLLLLPELAGDQSLYNKLQCFSTAHNMIVIGGSYYDERRINCCPIVIPGDTKPYIVEKIHPSPFERSPNKDAGIVAGSKIIVFKNTIAGSFGVLICSDYLNDALVEKVCETELDFLCIVSMNNDSPRFFEKMNSRCKNTQNGIYILYSNCLFSATEVFTADGFSSLFGFMDNLFLQKLKRNGDVRFDYQIASFPRGNSEGFLIANINLEEKRPVYRGPGSMPNISEIENKLFSGGF